MSRGLKILAMVNLKYPTQPDEPSEFSISNKEAEDTLNEAINNEILFAPDHCNISNMEEITRFLDNNNIVLNNSAMLSQPDFLGETLTDSALSF